VEKVAKKYYYNGKLVVRAKDSKPKGQGFKSLELGGVEWQKNIIAIEILCSGGTIVECVTHNSKIEGSNP
jgi:hypothetical protein